MDPKPIDLRDYRPPEANYEVTDEHDHMWTVYYRYHPNDHDLIVDHDIFVYVNDKTGEVKIDHGGQ